MTKEISRSSLKKQLEEKFNLKLGTTEEYYGNNENKGGLWIRDGLSTKLTDYFDYDFGYEKTNLNKFIESKGWIIYPYDSETMHLYKQSYIG
jgi:hypothetical protein